MSHEARCPNCGCTFELSPDELAAIVEAHRSSPPATADGQKDTRFVFRPELVERDGVQVLRIVPVSASRPKPSERGAPGGQATRSGPFIVCACAVELSTLNSASRLSRSMLRNW